MMMMIESIWRKKLTVNEGGGPQKIRFAKLQSFIAGFEKVDGEMLTDGFGFMVHKGLQGIREED